MANEQRQIRGTHYVLHSNIRISDIEFISNGYETNRVLPPPGTKLYFGALKKKFCLHFIAYKSENNDNIKNKGQIKDNFVSWRIDWLFSNLNFRQHGGPQLAHDFDADVSSRLGGAAKIMFKVYPGACPILKPPNWVSESATGYSKILGEHEAFLRNVCLILEMANSKAGSELTDNGVWIVARTNMNQLKPLAMEKLHKWQARHPLMTLEQAEMDVVQACEQALPFDDETGDELLAKTQSPASECLIDLNDDWDEQENDESVLLSDGTTIYTGPSSKLDTITAFQTPVSSPTNQQDNCNNDGISSIMDLEIPATTASVPILSTHDSIVTDKQTDNFNETDILHPTLPTTKLNDSSGNDEMESIRSRMDVISIEKEILLVEAKKLSAELKLCELRKKLALYKHGKA